MADKCIIIERSSGEIVIASEHRRIMSCKDAKREVQFGIGAIFPKNRYYIYKLKRIK